MLIQQKIELQLQENLEITFLQLENDSHLHSGMATESHFKLTLASPNFEGISKVKRHQMVYKILSQEIPKFHALALHLYSSKEWQKKSIIPDSTPCAGGHG